MRGEELINCAVLIVRYFGGIKLGTGGMARAYALSVKEVLSVSKLVEYEKKIEYEFSTSYSEIERTLYRLKKSGILEYERQFGINTVEWKINASAHSLKLFQLDSSF